MFGNVEPALHAHVFPRFADEPAATRGAHPWAFDWNLAPPWSAPLHGDLQRRIAAELAGGGAGPGGPAGVTNPRN
jgi:hypothetical protein